MRIGIDLGGTKIECIALADDGSVLFRKRVPTPRGDYEGTLKAIAALVGEAETGSAKYAPTGNSFAMDAASFPVEPASTATVGIGTPGAISPATGLVKNANSTWLNGRPMARDLEALLGRPLRFANDANCMTLSEAVDGAAEGAGVVFGVILGTGTGGGIVVDGRVLKGPNAIAGEWGHNPLPWPSMDELPGCSCYCGRTGCIETFLSGPGLVRDYLESLSSSDSRLHSRYEMDSEDVDPVAIDRAAQAGDPTAQGALRRYADRLARALASVINTLDPDVIVLAGGMSNLNSICEHVPRLWSTWVFSDRVDTRLVRARHGDSSGVRGAAWLWPACGS